MSAFERAGVAYLAGSRKSLKNALTEKSIVYVKDLYRAKRRSTWEETRSYLS